MRFFLLSLLLFALLSPACAQPATPAGPPQEDLLGNNPRRFTGATRPLGRAIAGQHPSTIRHLLQQHPDWLNRQDSVYGQTPLTFAVWNGWYRSAATLLELGANPNQRNRDNGYTPLIEVIAGLHPSEQLVGLLLHHGADPNQTATNTRHTQFFTPLIAAASDGNLPLMRQLVAAGATAQVPVPEEGSLLLWAGLAPRPAVVYYCVAELHADAAQRLGTTVQGQPIHLVNLMREWIFPLGSPQHQEKMKLVDYLKTQGIDYRSTPIPAWRAERMTPEYQALY
jgi:hypothetical protein